MCVNMCVSKCEHVFVCVNTCVSVWTCMCVCYGFAFRVKRSSLLFKFLFILRQGPHSPRLASVMLWRSE